MGKARLGSSITFARERRLAVRRLDKDDEEERR